MQSSGTTLKAAEKYELLVQGINKAGAKQGWLPVTAKNVDNRGLWTKQRDVNVKRTTKQTI